MKFCTFFPIIFLAAGNLSAQNVGIGTTNPDRGKLMVVGTPNANSNTVALFGTNAGISIQQAWPTIGFNQYRDFPTGNGRTISTGYGMHMAFNYNNGDFAWFRNGWAEAGNSLPQQGVVWAFVESGYKLLLNSSIAGGKVELANKVTAAQTGNLNLVPLGIMAVDFTYFPGSGISAQASNKVGTLYSNYLGSRNGTTCRLTLTLNSSVTSGYGELLVIPGYNFVYGNSGALLGVETIVLNEAPKKIQITVLMAAESSQFDISGNLLVYGVLQ